MKLEMNRRARLKQLVVLAQVAVALTELEKEAQRAYVNGDLERLEQIHKGVDALIDSISGKEISSDGSKHLQ